MSVTIEVYLRDRVSAEQLRAIASAERRGDWAEVDGPQSVEAEDLPPGLDGSGIGDFRWLVTIHSLLDEAVGLTESLARKVAQAGSGAVVDPATGGVWLSSNASHVPSSSLSVQTSTLDLWWALDGEGDPESQLGEWLAVASDVLPQAIPRRYGLTEPFPETFKAGSGATQLMGHANEFRFNAVRPVLDGSWGPRSYESGGVRALRPLAISVLINADSHDWVAASRDLFIKFSRRSSAVIGLAQIKRGWENRRGRVWATAATESTLVPIQAGRFVGLPPYPVSWAWFGADYVRESGFVGALAGSCIRFPEGALQTLAEQPEDRDAIADRLAGEPWSSSEYSAVATPRAGGRGFLVRGSGKIPASLRCDEAL